jgi:hypothetical protein
MKARNLFVMMGMGLALCASSIVSGQTIQQTHKNPAAKQPPQQTSKATPVFRSGLPPGFLDQNEPGDHFTDSSMRGVTRAGTIDVMTGTAGSDVNGQIGTTNQGNMVHGTMGGIFTTHFGSGESHKRAPIEAHRSPRAKDNQR